MITRLLRNLMINFFPRQAIVNQSRIHTTISIVQIHIENIVSMCKSPSFYIPRSPAAFSTSISCSKSIYVLPNELLDSHESWIRRRSNERKEARKNHMKNNRSRSKQVSQLTNRILFCILNTSCLHSHFYISHIMLYPSVFSFLDQCLHMEG